MNALFIVLNKTDYLDDILKTLVEMGVGGATILESQGMARAIVHGGYDHIPLFGSLKLLVGDEHPYNKTIFTVIENDELVDLVAAKLREVIDERDKPNSGFMFTVPVGHIIPFNGKNPRK